MPDDASVVNGPKLEKMIYGNIGAGHINALRALLRAFDQLVQGTVKEINQNTPPPTPANGDAYGVGGAPTGAWAGQANKLAVWSTEIATVDTDTKVPAWEFFTPKYGWLFFDEGTDRFVTFRGGQWSWTMSFYFLTLQRSRGISTTPDIVGNGTNALVIAGKADGSGLVKMGATSPLQLASFTVAGLPAANDGQMSYASDGRKTGEGAAAGTGVIVYFSNSQWRRFSDDTVVAA